MLFTATPGFGHVHPLLPLANAYRQQGCAVAFTTGPDLVHVPRRYGFESWATGLTMREAERCYLARFPTANTLPPEQRLPLVTAQMFGDIAARARLADLVPLARRWQPDLVVHDVTEFAGPLAALRLGIPFLAHGVSLVNPTSGTVTAVAAVLDALGAESGVANATARMLDAPYLDLCPPSLGWPAPNPYPDVRPLRPQLPPAHERELPAELDALPYDRTLLVTLGTVVNSAPGAFARLLAALDDMPVNLVVTVGPDLDPSDLGRQPRHVVVQPYLPYDLLLPRCAAVLGHAGAGTLFATLAAGLPSVLVPQGAEQIANAHAVAAAGAAIALPPEQVSEPAIRTAVRQVLDRSEYADAARRIGHDIGAQPSAIDVATALRPVARHRVRVIA
ncbi:MAG TPA: glycosyltransferase [Jatrophihabitantaceae bacterium]